MALSFSDNIGYSGSRNNFERDYYATIADMVAVKKTRMPTMFIAMCGETGKAYLYNKSNEVDETLGLWREIALAGEISGGSSSGGGNTTPTVANPSITISEGNVTITCSTNGAVIYYTTDGTAPSTSSTAYTAAFTVESGVTIKAVAVKDGVYSSTVSKTYTTGGSTGGDPVVDKDYAYFGYLNVYPDSEDDENHHVTAENFEATVKALSNKEEATSKGRTITFVAGQAEQDAYESDTGHTFLAYAYPSKFGDLSTYSNTFGTDSINNYSKLVGTVDGVEYNLYISRAFFAESGDTFTYTYA